MNCRQVNCRSWASGAIVELSFGYMPEEGVGDREKDRDRKCARVTNRQMCAQVGRLTYRTSVAQPASHTCPPLFAEGEMSDADDKQELSYGWFGEFERARSLAATESEEVDGMFSCCGTRQHSAVDCLHRFVGFWTSLRPFARSVLSPARVFAVCVRMWDCPDYLVLQEGRAV